MSLLSYHKSINAELVTLKNRVRDLIEPGVQWAEDGRHKEVVLRQVLRRYLPEHLRLSSGFVRLDGNSSNQMDILVTNHSAPTLFREDDFQIVTPSLVEAVIEVKTKVTRATLRASMEKLADNISRIRAEKQSDGWRRKGGLPNIIDPWAGIFVYEECDIAPQEVVEMAREVTAQEIIRSIQAICLGPNIFVRFWTTAIDPLKPSRPAWHCYKLRDLAYSYFLGNAIWLHDDSAPEQRHWFPLEEGKEVHLQARVELLAPYK